MLKIRPYQDSDKADVEHICIATAPKSMVSSEKLTEQTLLLYSRYYTRLEQSHCFVLTEGEEERAVGYILCAPDYKYYKQQFMTNEVKALRKLGPSAVIQAYGEVTAPKPFSKKYPAHLHIDILPAYQHQGMGTKLMDTLVQHLCELGVPGVLLVVGAENQSSIAFYQKYGFQRLGNIGGGVVFGLEIHAEA